MRFTSSWKILCSFPTVACLVASLAAPGVSAQEGVTPPTKKLTFRPPRKSAPETPPAEAKPPAEPAPIADSKPPAELKPIAETAAKKTPAGIDARATAFRDVEPGKTTTAQLKKAWGDPARSETADALTLYTYELNPFKKIEVLVEDETVTSVVVHLGNPLKPDDVANQLSLTQLRPVPVPNEVGELLGQAYPERGVLFGFSPESKTPAVSQIVLEPIVAEPFVLRARYDFDHNYRRDLDDLDFALSLDPKDPQAHWLKAKVLCATGRCKEALASAAEAVRLDGTSVDYRLTEAHLLAQLGKHETAVEKTKQVLAIDPLPPQTKARAECLLGDLLLTGAERDYKKAIEHHMAAVKLATPLASDRRFAVRRAAKLVLVDAHLGIARNIALGNWQRKPEVTVKWLQRAETLVEDLLQRDRGDPALRLLLHRRTLSAYAALRGKKDPNDVADAAMREARRLIAKSRDRLFQRRVESELGELLIDALQIEHLRGKHDQALRYANSAIALLEGARPHRQPTPYEDYRLGRLYFLVGSIHAIGKQEHEEAVVWYEKALPLLARPVPPRAFAGKGRIGEAFVSVGVSYWETGSRKDAVRLTEEGLDLMQRAVEDGTLKRSAMAVPYSNLATMHKALGQPEKAKTFAEMAARLESDALDNKQR